MILRNWSEHLNKFPLDRVTAPLQVRFWFFVRISTTLLLLTFTIAISETLSNGREVIFIVAEHAKLGEEELAGTEGIKIVPAV